MAISTQDLFEMSKRLTVKLSNTESDEIRTRIQRRRGDKGGKGTTILENNENEPSQNWTTNNTLNEISGGGGYAVVSGGWIRTGAVDLMTEEVFYKFENLK